MSSAEIRRIIFEHIVDSPQCRFVCVNVDGRTRNLRVYKDGSVETYENGRFVRLPSELAKHIRLALGRTQRIPTFEIRSAEGLLPA